MNTHRADPPAETGRRGPILTAPVRRWLYGIAAAAAPLVDRKSTRLNSSHD